MNISVTVQIDDVVYARGVELGNLGMTKLPDFIVEASLKMIIDTIVDNYKEEKNNG